MIKEISYAKRITCECDMHCSVNSIMVYKREHDYLQSHDGDTDHIAAYTRTSTIRCRKRVKITDANVILQQLKHVFVELHHNVHI